ncbi:MAG: glycine--tRNA ligase subunit beta [Acidobacteria bacterium]|nr:glycine--tRNA ligase subunit beta [Acidobacteriota bacterium]
MLPFLLEVGAEEIPDWMIPAALEQLGKDFQSLLEAHKLGGRVTRTDGTGRRLVLWAEGLVERQADSVEIVSGPPKGANPNAVAGFAKKSGVSVDDLQVETTARGEYYTFRRQVAGRATAELLAELLPELIQKLYFPKTMFWTGKGGPKFIRPIRWIVALLGDRVVPFTLAGVESGNESSAHRKLGAGGPIPVTIANYEAELEKNFVIVSSAARRAKIEREVAGLGNAQSDPKLLETLTFITEYPSAIRGGFDASYLTLPQEVLTMVMRFHQKYFAVNAADGSLAPHFIAVMNIPADPEGHVVRGNERVLRARFNDARFFYDVDQKRPLLDRVADLANVTFQAKIGSYLEKTSRMVALAQELGGEAAAEAAYLAKADLTTEMVKEFTDLQGIIGGLYIAAQGGRPDVAKAVYEHYKPLSMEDTIPSTVTGQAVALADKVDTLRSCFAVDMIPTGSKDPFALRRAAQGVVKILVEGELSPSLQQLAAGDSKLEEFFLERVKHYFREVKGYAYDEVNAVLAVGWADLKDVALRLEAVKAVRPTPNFEPVAAAFKRIKNILTQAGTLPAGAPEASLFNEAEAGVAAAARQAAIKDGGYPAQLERIAGLRPAIDHFFDQVLVNDPDPAVRDNRLRLLNELINEFSSIADFSEIVTK